MDYENNEIELCEDYAVIMLPENSVEVRLEVKVFENGELMTVQKTMDFGDIRQAFKMGEEDLFPSDAVYQLTDRGRELKDWLEENKSEEF